MITHLEKRSKLLDIYEQGNNDPALSFDAVKSMKKISVGHKGGYLKVWDI